MVDSPLTGGLLDRFLRPGHRLLGDRDHLDTLLPPSEIRVQPGFPGRSEHGSGRGLVDSTADLDRPVRSGQDICFELFLSHCWSSGYFFGLVLRVTGHHRIFFIPCSYHVVRTTSSHGAFQYIVHRFAVQPGTHHGTFGSRRIGR